ncbi:hypothetical protein SODG_001235 [Sodalis praecaptivus]
MPVFRFLLFADYINRKKIRFMKTENPMKAAESLPHYYQLSVTDTLERINSAEHGLSREEAASWLRTHGENVLPQKRVSRHAYASWRILMTC